MRGGNPSLRQTRHVLRLMGRRMTSVYGSSALLDSSLRLASARCHHRCWSSDFHKHHQRSTLIFTSQTKDGNGSDSGGGAGNKDPGDRKTVTTTTTPSATPSSGTTTTSTTTGDQHHLRDVPRRILVKKSGSTAAEMNAPGKAADSSYNTKHLKQQQHVGYLKRRFPLHNEST